MRPPSPSTVSNILYDDLGYRYVNCARRFNPAPTRETEYTDQRFARVVRNLTAYSAHYEVLFLDEFQPGIKKLAQRTWRFGNAPRVVRSVRALGLNVLVAASRFQLYAAQVLRHCTTNSERFLNFLRTVVKKRKEEMAREGNPAQLVVVFDNAAIHKTALVVEFLRASGTLGLTLRPYRPEWNLAELFIRNAQESLRSELRQKL